MTSSLAEFFAMLRSRSSVARLAVAFLALGCTRDRTPAEACVEAAAAICERQADCGQLSTTLDDCKQAARQSCVSGLTCPTDGRFDTSKVDGCISQIRTAACTSVEDPMSLPSCALVCTTAEGTPAGTGSVGAGGQGGTAAGPDCNGIGEGLNTYFMVDGLAREFILHVPDNGGSGGPFPVIFNWHGLGDTADNMDALISPYVSDASFPFIAITPEDSDYRNLGYIMDWDVFQVNSASNREARLFDELLVCLQKKYPVDPTHIHSVGFSMGAILTDMLGTIRGDKLASIATFSGGYFSNSADVATLGPLSSQVKWPAPTHGNAYAQLILHGGTTDLFNFSSITVHFDTFAANDTAYLNRLHHDVVLCDHGSGHTAPVADFDVPQVLEFFKAHPKGTINSPYSTALPADYPSYCTFNAKK